MKIMFSKLQMKDIDGKVVVGAELYKTIANALWRNAKNLDLVEIAMIINRGVEIDVSKKELLEIERIVKDPKSGFFAFAQKQILDFIDKVRESEKKKNKKEKK